MTKKELIWFLDELVELASEENKTKALLVKENFISDFEKSYECKELIENTTTIQDSLQEEVKQQVIAVLTEYGKCTPENVDRALSSKVYNMKNLTDVREYIKRIEAENKKGEQKRRGSR